MNEYIAGGTRAAGSSVTTRANWGAVLAGSVLAFGFFLLFESLGAAVGVSMSGHVRPAALHDAVIGWAFLSTVAAFFVGGLVTTLFTLGENRVEAILHGLIMWAVLMAVLVGLGVAGVRMGVMGMTALAHTSSANDWELAAKAAGVAPDELERMRRSINSSIHSGQQVPNQQELTDAAKRVGWYAFAAIWVSMIASAAGAWLGAGPTFRVVVAAVRPSIQTTAT